MFTTHVNYFIKNLKYSEYADSNGVGPNQFDLRHGYLNYSQISDKFNTLFKKIDKSKVISYKYAQDKDLLKKINLMENVPVKNIVVTDGADAALHHVAETFLTINKKALILVPSFPRMEFHVKVVGAKPIFINTYGFCEEEKLKTISSELKKERVNVIFLESPNNPTGEIISSNYLSNFLNNVDNATVVIDQSLSGYYNNSLSELILKFPNVIVIKSFSKLLGLPGLRIGYLIASTQLIKFIKRTISPYEISTLSLEIAKEFIDNKLLINFRKNQVINSLQYIKNKLKINSSDSKGPFILLDGKDKISNLYNKLLLQKFIVVDGKNFRGLETTNTVRISLTNYQYVKRLVNAINLL